MEIMHLFLYKNWQVNEFKRDCVNIKIYTKVFFKVQFSIIELLKKFISSEMCVYSIVYILYIIFSFIHNHSFIG